MRQASRTPEANDQSDHFRSRQLPRSSRRGGVFAPAFAAIRAANDGSVPEEKLRAAFAACWRVASDAVGDKYGFTEAMRAAGWQVFRQTAVNEPMYGYGDLAVLKDMHAQRFLVT